MGNLKKFLAKALVVCLPLFGIPSVAKSSDYVLGPNFTISPLSVSRSSLSVKESPLEYGQVPAPVNQTRSWGSGGIPDYNSSNYSSQDVDLRGAEADIWALNFGFAASPLPFPIAEFFRVGYDLALYTTGDNNILSTSGDSNRPGRGLSKRERYIDNRTGREATVRTSGGGTRDIPFWNSTYTRIAIPGFSHSFKAFLDLPLGAEEESGIILRGGVSYDLMNTRIEGGRGYGSYSGRYSEQEYLSDSLRLKGLNPFIELSLFFKRDSRNHWGGGCLEDSIEFFGFWKQKNLKGSTRYGDVELEGNTFGVGIKSNL
jgi:hypothetical protein